MTDEVRKHMGGLHIFSTNEVSDYTIQANWVLESDVIALVEELTKWNKVEDKTPIAFETGDWDGKRSDIVIAKDSCGVVYIARVYEGIIDGRKYCDFADLDDFLIDEITEWKYIN